MARRTTTTGAADELSTALRRDTEDEFATGRREVDAAFQKLQTTLLRQVVKTACEHRDGAVDATTDEMRERHEAEIAALQRQIAALSSDVERKNTEIKRLRAIMGNLSGIVAEEV